MAYLSLGVMKLRDCWVVDLSSGIWSPWEDSMMCGLENLTILMWILQAEHRPDRNFQGQVQIGDTIGESQHCVVEGN